MTQGDILDFLELIFNITIGLLESTFDGKGLPPSTGRLE